jgi:predicted RNase H-like HicB family nuclease
MGGDAWCSVSSMLPAAISLHGLSAAMVARPSRSRAFRLFCALAKPCYNAYHSASEPFGGYSKMKDLKIVVEKHPDVYVAYPLGLKGVVVGQGDTYEAALEDVKSAIQFHLETFGPEALEVDPPILEAFVAETRLAF